MAVTFVPHMPYLIEITSDDHFGVFDPIRSERHVIVFKQLVALTFLHFSRVGYRRFDTVSGLQKDMEKAFIYGNF